MGRRSSHTPEELHKLIVEAASEIIAEKGYQALSARSIAVQIGYSPGTLYNVFKDLDHLVLTIEQRLLDGLADRLAAAEKSGDAVQDLRHVARAFYGFAHDRPRLWNLLFEHQMPRSWTAPPQFQARIDRLIRIIEQACAPFVGEGDAARLHRTAVVVWGALFGIAQLATTDKLKSSGQEPVPELIDALMGTLATGLSSPTAQPKKRRKK